MIKVLLVEDSQNVAQVIFDYFEDTDIELDYAANGTHGFELAKSQDWDAIILDIMLPGLDGMEICQQLRKLGHTTPILMLTARDSDQDTIAGFDIGADDYLIKPFNLEILEARLRNLLRRRQGQGFSQQLCFGEINLDLANHTAYRNNQALKLTPVGFKIITVLVQAGDKITSRSELERQIWPDDLPDNDVLRKHLYQLRIQLDKPFAYPLLETIPKVGYRLKATQ
jgi:DNA-binding response OmpR family regulator